jgi:GTP cyclohydrolase III
VIPISALADALVAAQSRAVAALGKQYASGTMDEDELRAALTEIGQNDPADTSQWIAALDIIRATGAALPRENGAQKDEHATEAQVKLIRSLADTKGFAMPTLPLSKEQAHEIIDTMKAGTYDAGKWAVPF